MAGSKSKKKKNKSKGNKENAGKHGGDGHGSTCGQASGQAGSSQLPQRSHGHSAPGGGDSGNWRDVTVRVPVKVIDKESKNQISKPTPDAAFEVKVTIEAPLVLSAPAATLASVLKVALTEPEIRLPMSSPETALPLSAPETAMSLSEPETTMSLSEPETTMSLSEPETTMSLSEPEAARETVLPLQVPEATCIVSEAELPLPITPEPELQDQDFQVNSTSKVINCLLEAELVLDPASITVGQDIYSHKVQRYEGHVSGWDSYKYAKRDPTGFSSLALSMSSENIKRIGTTDFVGDAECFKKIFKMSKSPGVVSLLMHRVGESILVDNYELNDLLISTYPPHKPEWEKFSKFVMRVIDKEVPEIRWSEKTLNKMHRKAVTHYLFYKCLQGEMAFKPAAELVPETNMTQPPKVTLEGAETAFLNTIQWEVEGYKILLGSQVPRFRVSAEDEAGDSEFKSDVVTTIAVNNSEYDKILSLDHGMDIWLDNLMLDAEQTFICHQEDSYVLRTEMVKTVDLPKAASFNPLSVLDRAKDVLDFIKSFVNKSGTSYWLYKAPNTKAFGIYNLSQCLADDHDLESDPPKSIIAKSNPYMEGVGSLLYKMCSLHGTKYHLLSLQGMLRNILYIYPPETHPLLAMSAMLIYLEGRIPTEIGLNFQPKVNVLNGVKTPEINFFYDWLGPDNDLVIPSTGAIRDRLHEAHQACYRELGRMLEPESFETVLRLQNGDGIYGQIFPPTAIARLQQMVQPLHVHLDKLIIPTLVIDLLRRGNRDDLPISIKEYMDGRFHLSTIQEAEAYIRSIPVMLKPEPAFRNTARLVFSLECCEVVEPMEISTPVTESTIKLSKGLQDEKMFEFSKPPPKMVTIEPQPITTQPRSAVHTNKKRKYAEKLAPPLFPTNQITSISPTSKVYKPLNWFKFCEQQSLIRVFIGTLKLMHQLSDKYNVQKFKPTKKNKKLEIPAELAFLKKRLYEKISLFSLHLAYEGIKPDQSVVPHVMMSRYCARLAIFLNNALGEARQEIQISGWLVSGHSLKHLVRGVDGISNVKAYTTDFENGLREHCAEFMEFVKLALDNRNPEQAHELKTYELFPTTRTALHKGLSAAYLCQDLSSLTKSKRQCVSESISVKLGDIGLEFLKQNQERIGFMDKNLTKDKLEQRTWDAVADAINYLEEAIQFVPSASSQPHLAELYLSMAEVHCLRTRVILKDGPAPLTTPAFLEACDSILGEGLKFCLKALAILKKPDADGVESKYMLNQARWKTHIIHLEICNILWVFDNLNNTVLERMLDHYYAALKLVDGDYNRGFPDYGTILFREAETYEAIAVTRKETIGFASKNTISFVTKTELLPGGSKMFLPRLKFQNNGKNMNPDNEHKSNSSESVAGKNDDNTIVGEISKDFYSSAMAYARVEAPSFFFYSYLGYMDCKLFHMTIPEEKSRVELSLLCQARNYLRLYEPGWMHREQNLAHSVWRCFDRIHHEVVPSSTKKVKIAPAALGDKDGIVIFTTFFKRLDSTLKATESIFHGYESTRALVWEKMADVGTRLRENSSDVKFRSIPELASSLMDILNEVVKIPLGLGSDHPLLKPMDRKTGRFKTGRPMRHFSTEVETHDDQDTVEAPTVITHVFL